VVVLALLAACDCTGEVGDGGPGRDGGPRRDAGPTLDAPDPTRDAGGADGGDAAVQCIPARPDGTGAFTFDGVDDSVHLGWGDRALFDAGETISVMGWVEPASSDGYDTVVARPAPCANGGNFMVDLNGGVLRFCYVDPTQTVSHCHPISTVAIPIGAWTHFAFTYRYGDPASFVAWVDGMRTPDLPWSNGDGTSAPLANARHAANGGHYAGCATGAEYFFHGRTHGIGVYERALADEDVRAAYCGRATPLGCLDARHQLRPIERILVDADATGYATFQSHNQKITDGPHGTFFAYIRTRNEAYTAQTWRLLHWPRGAAGFGSIVEETQGTNPPVLETDLAGDVYLMRQNYHAPPDSTMYIFRAAAGFAGPAQATIPLGNSGKYAMYYDPIRDQLYYFSHEGRFYTIDRNGAVLASPLLITSGPWGGPQYPLITMDEAGVIYAAWTTVRHGEYLYRNIGVARSLDAGASWQKLDGTPLALPIVCDETGAADMVNLPDELEVHTWLWSLAARHGKLHLAYLAQHTPARQHYVRYDLATGALDRRVQPDFRGEQLSLRNLDGFVVTDPGSPRRVFWVSVSQDGTGSRLAVLQSVDGGETWLDYAAAPADGTVHYAVTGYRQVTADGWILGAYADVRDPMRTAVQFFRVRVREPGEPVLCF
jgi:hypothetical protein